MDYDYSELIKQTKKWTEQLTEQGWLNRDSLQQISELNDKSPDSLFDSSASRPLIVAFMGGTGVGKSTLINRLAGQAIAKTGIVRPTSREVTLYHHQSVEIQHLPDDLPIGQVKIAQHQDPDKKNIIWMDMPDFDSIEQSNKHLVMQWLPHIDVLIYVVSPERYRDNKAWRILLAEGGKHAWVFVLNQWDRGQPEQFDDFKRQLSLAEFNDPIIYKTICEQPQTDEFDQLSATITSLANKNTIAQLENRGLHLRKEQLKDNIEQLLPALGADSDFQVLSQQWQELWQQAVQTFSQGFAWPIKNLASYYAEQSSHLIEDNRNNPLSDRHTKNDNLRLWDHWAQSRFDDVLDDLILTANQSHIPALPLKKELTGIRNKAAKKVHGQIELSTRQALANPGNVVQRGLLKLTRFCETLLPLLAMAWVGYQVFQGYYNSNISDHSYLGVDFAIHSSLLIAITWLVPFFILKKLQPSQEKAALLGLNKGLSLGLNSLMLEVEGAIENIRHARHQHVKQARDIIQQCDIKPEITVVSDQQQTLQRMLID